jgi:hypothetical protein
LSARKPDAVLTDRKSSDNFQRRSLHLTIAPTVEETLQSCDAVLLLTE